jgi:hypothetical protein
VEGVEPLNNERISAFLLLDAAGVEEEGVISLFEPKMSASRSCVDGPDVF